MNGFLKHEFTSQLVSLTDRHLNVNALPTQVSLGLPVDIAL